MSIDVLLGKQNRDGGWPYVRGASWTEPTVYSVLALLAAGEHQAAERGIEWILRARRADGGFPPAAGIDQSSWVTALVALLPPQRLGVEVHDRAIRWVMDSEDEESTPTFRLRQWLLGNGPLLQEQFPGWPWLPGTAAWVGPTSVSILALEMAEHRQPSPKIRRRIEEGRHYLTTHMCKDGGWNHGSANALGYQMNAYPETTGMALTALRGAGFPGLQLALNRARAFLTECRSADALNWLRLGLMAHGQLPPGYCRPRDVACRTLVETSLEWLVSRVEDGRDPFLV